MAEPSPIQVGDWVAHQRNGGIVVSVVRYTAPAEYYWQGQRLFTDNGEVPASHVLEVRRG